MHRLPIVDPAAPAACDAAATPVLSAVQPVDPARLIAPMLEHFMRNDRGSRRGAAKPKTGL